MSGWVEWLEARRRCSCEGAGLLRSCCPGRHLARGCSKHKLHLLQAVPLLVQASQRCTGHLTESPAGSYFMLLAEKCLVRRGHFYSILWVPGVGSLEMRVSSAGHAASERVS